MFRCGSTGVLFKGKLTWYKCFSLLPVALVLGLRQLGLHRRLGGDILAPHIVHQKESARTH